MLVDSGPFFCQLPTENDTSMFKVILGNYCCKWRLQRVSESSSRSGICFRSLSQWMLSSRCALLCPIRWGKGGAKRVPPTEVPAPGLPMRSTTGPGISLVLCSEAFTIPFWASGPAGCPAGRDRGGGGAAAGGRGCGGRGARPNAALPEP